MSNRKSLAWAASCLFFAASLLGNDARSEAVSDTQTRLLRIAFETASSIPINPHQKDRSRAQEEVIQICLELNRIEIAEEWIDRIEGWRRGTAMADLAGFQADRGEVEIASRLIDEASTIASSAEDWRRDRIRGRIAGVLAQMGRLDAAYESERGVEIAETGRVELALAKSPTDASLEDRLVGMESLLSSENFDAMRNGLAIGRELYSSRYADPDFRARIEAGMRITLQEMPPFLKIAILMDLAEAALEHGDSAEALVTLNEAWETIQNRRWGAEHRLPMSSRWAILCHRAGGEEIARAELNDLLDLYRQERHTLSDIWRSGALRPVAEAFQAIGDGSEAARVYRMALEEGVSNPNSRPRALDLAAVCASMAKVGYEPNEEVWSQIAEIRASLGAPW